MMCPVIKHAWIDHIPKFSSFTRHHRHSGIERVHRGLMIRSKLSRAGVIKPTAQSIEPGVNADHTHSLCTQKPDLWFLSSGKEGNGFILSQDKWVTELRDDVLEAWNIMVLWFHWFTQTHNMSHPVLRKHAQGSKKACTRTHARTHTHTHTHRWIWWNQSTARISALRLTVTEITFY